MAMMGPSTATTIGRTALQLYRDCLRLVRHVAPGDSKKGILLRRTVREEFRCHRNQTDLVMIERLKADAVRALSNYLLAVNANKDRKLKTAMQDFHDRSVPTNKNNTDTTDTITK
jgi:hypothetical protein